MASGQKLNIINKSLSGLLLSVVLTQLIIGGVLLPFKKAQAYPAEITSDPFTLSQMAKDAAAWAEDKWDWALSYAEEVQTDVASWQTAASTLWQELDKKYKDALNWAWTQLKKKLLDMLVDDIIKWVQGGGSPRIVTDWQGYLKSAADQVGGMFIEDYLNAGFLCKNFNVSLSILLAKPPTFDKAATCTISKVVSNLEDFIKNFTNGGWSGWLSVQETENNLYGMYLYAQDKKWSMEEIAEKAGVNEALSSSGFLPVKVCVESMKNGEKKTYTARDDMSAEDLSEGERCTKWTNTTPGHSVAAAMDEALNSDIKVLEISDEWYEYISQIFNAVINRTIREGITAMQTSSGSAGQSGAGITSPPNLTANLSSYESATKDTGYSANLTEQEKLLKTNLGTTLNNYQTNLSILNTVKSNQESALSLAQQFGQGNNCSLPAGTTVASESAKLNNTNNEIAQTQNEITSIQNQINKTTQAITDVTAYQTALENYKKAYDAAQRSPNDQPSKVALTKAESDALSAKQKAISSTQGILGSSYQDIPTLTQGIKDLSQQAVRKVSTIQSKRGVIIVCPQAIAGTYYGDICAAQQKQKDLQTALDNCLHPQPGI